MMKVKKGDILQSQAQTLVNTVNCVGVMGKGIALEFKKRFPDMFKDYLERCRREEVKLGRPYLYRRVIAPWILNFPTKDHWRSFAKVKDIKDGLEYLRQHYKEWGIRSLAVPPLGCGQGQLEWRIVGRILYKYLNQLDIPVELYAPYDTPQEQLQVEFLASDAVIEPALDEVRSPERVRPAWVALVEILRRLENEPYHWPVGRIKFQKIAYIATLEGLPTGLDFQKGSFGPFSSELKRIMTKLVNNGLIREERLGQMIATKVGLAFEDACEAYRGDLDKWSHIIEKIADLFMRVPRTKQSELVATVLFAADELRKAGERKPSESDVLAEVMKWKERHRPPLDEGEVAYTIRNLAALKWLKVKPNADLPIPEWALAEV